jgi:peptidoglycan/LPS O-acetylase OafA/YrhL
MLILILLPIGSLLAYLNIKIIYKLIKMILWVVQFVVAVESLTCKEMVMAVVNRTTLPTDNISYAKAINLLRYSGKGINDMGQYVSCIRDPGFVYYTLNYSISGASCFTGLCVPKSCSYIELSQALSSYTSKINIKTVDEKPLTSGSYLFILVTLFFLGIGIAGSYLKTENKTIVNSILKAFSIKKNYENLISIRQSREGDYTNILDGVRVLSLFIIIIGHSFSFKTHNALVNVEAYLYLGKSYKAILVHSGTSCVDTFFWMSGFLVGYLLLKEVEKKRGKFGLLGWMFVYVHRFLRIIPVYAFMMFFFIKLMPALHAGPMWFNQDIIVKDCGDYWWSVLLFLNNFVPDGQGNQCLGVGWFLANDMQFYILSPGIILMYYFSARWVSWAVKAIMLAIGFIVAYFVAEAYEFRECTMSHYNFVEGRDIYHIYYTKPYIRFAPYLIGMYTGFIYLRYVKTHIEKQEDTHKDPVCTLAIKLWTNKYTAWISLLSSCLIVARLILVQHELYANPFEDIWSPEFNYFYMPFKKLLFSYCLTFALMPVMLGRIYIVRVFLSSKFFNVLAKLCFIAYLIEFGVVLGLNAIQDTSIMILWSTMLRDAWIGAFISFVLSVPVYLLVEAPFANLEKIMCSAIRGNR